MIQCCIDLAQRCFNVVSTLGTDVAPTFHGVENLMSDFVSFLTSEQWYFNVNPQRWNNIDSTLKYWLESNFAAGFVLPDRANFFWSNGYFCPLIRQHSGLICSSTSLQESKMHWTIIFRERAFMLLELAFLCTPFVIHLSFVSVT